MAKTRETPCLYYKAFGECERGRSADHAHYCQHCDKYRPRAKVRHINRKKQEIEKIRREEKY